MPTKLHANQLEGAAMMPSPPRDGSAEQTLVEHDVLQHVGRALEACMDWKVAEVSWARKFGSVRFTAQSFARHLERLLVLEEDGGYMDQAQDVRPHWAARIAALREEHDTFRSALARIHEGWNALRQGDEAGFEALCGQLRKLLADLTRHHSQERELLLEMMYDTAGGEA